MPKIKKEVFKGKCHFYDKKDVIKTPENLYKFLNDFFNFNHDPCPISPEFDGLNSEWGEMNFVNPPYSEIKKWVIKGLEERDKGRNSLFLITVRTSTKYWFKKVFKEANKIWFIKSGICFEDYDKPLPIPLCLVLFCTKDFNKNLPGIGFTKWQLNKKEDETKIKNHKLNLFGMDLNKI